MKHYSRRTCVRIDQLGAGDLVDISASALPSWAAVDWIGRCDDDEVPDENCENPDLCDGVVFFVDAGVQHVPGMVGSVYARLLADADEDTVEAENEAQAEAHAVAYAAKVAAYQAELAHQAELARAAG